MSYFLCQQSLQIGQEVVLQGAEARHILLSRRMKRGDQIELQSEAGKRYLVDIQDSSRNSLTVKVVSQISMPPELPVKLVLFQAVVSQKTLDIILQKATELGASEIGLFNSQNTPTKLSTQQFEKKFERWEKILWEAAKQSGRGQIPELKFFRSIDQVLLECKNFDQCFVLDVSGQRLNLNQSFKSCVIMVGPEGGFTKLELEKLQSLPNAFITNISSFTLRAETAAISGLALIQYLF